MWNVDLRKIFIRAYIKFLLDEVTVVPKKDLDITILGDEIKLMVGEKKRMPRYIARVLKKHGIVDIENELDDKQIITQLINLVSSFKVSPRLLPLPQGFYARVAEAICRANDELKTKILSELTKMISIRATRIAHRLNTGSLEDMDILEREFFQVFYSIFEEFKKTIIEEMPKILKELGYPG